MPNRAASASRPADAADAEARRAQVIEAAIAIADRDGLDAVSIRRVAQALGTRPMSLYTYIVSKEELLELMAEQIVGEVLIRDLLPTDWRAAVEVIATRSRQVFTTHPWVLAISQRRTSLGRNALRHAEQLLTAIAPLGLPARESWEALFLINDYTLGHALRLAHAAPGPPHDYPEFDPADYPRLAQALRQPVPARDPNTFRAGLHMLLASIERGRDG